MARKFSFILSLVAVLICSVYYAMGWGVWGHNKINRGAVMALPKEMGLFFYNHADYITEESVAPDIRKYTMGDKSEFPRHYIDLEKYNYVNQDNMPKTLEDAKQRFGKDSVDAFGTLPWTIQEMTAKLTQAMKTKNRAEILFIAANLGHYIGDAHMPLHTTINHDGQFTGQKGIHSLWESQLPELFGKNYSLYCEAHYIENIEKTTWDMLDSSHKLMGDLLSIEKHLRVGKPDAMLYRIGTNGQPDRNKYGQMAFSYEYAHIYHELLMGMVEYQMRSAVAMVASYWYTAWVNAGRPDLSNLDTKYLIERNEKFYQEDMKYWKKGKVTGYKVINDF